MDQNSLVIDQIAAGANFLGEFHKYVPVQAAFWLKESEEGEWSLYVTSDEITDDNFDVAYGEVVRIAAAIHDPWFDPFRVKLIDKDDPFAQAAADIQRRYPAHNSIRLHATMFGGVSVDEVYFYPPMHAAVVP